MVDHDRKCKAGMLLGLLHDQLCGLIHGITWPVPIDDHAVDTAAHHVVNLASDLIRVGRAVADVHMVRLPEPHHQMGVDLGARAGIKQRMDVDLADVSRAAVSIRLCLKRIRCARIIGGLSREGGRGNYIRR